MEIKTIIKEIGRLPLKKRFLIMEQTLASIKKEGLGNQKTDFDREDDFPYLASEKSLAKDWLSEDDDRWDAFL